MCSQRSETNYNIENVGWKKAAKAVKCKTQETVNLYSSLDSDMIWHSGLCTEHHFFFHLKHFTGLLDRDGNLFARGNYPIILSLGPVHGLLFAGPVFGLNAFCLAFLVCDAETWPTQHHVEVQAIHTNAWVIIVSQIDVFLDPQTKASSI